MSRQYDRIKFLCQSQSITVSEMAAKLHIHRSRLAALNKGEKESLPVADVIAIADYFRCSTDYILQGIESPDIRALRGHNVIIMDGACVIGKKEDVYVITIDAKSERFKRLVKSYLFGIDTGITDDLLDQVQQYARLLLEEKKKPSK